MLLFFFRVLSVSLERVSGRGRREGPPRRRAQAHFGETITDAERYLFLSEKNRVGYETAAIWPREGKGGEGVGSRLVYRERDRRHSRSIKSYMCVSCTCSL